MLTEGLCLVGVILATLNAAFIFSHFYPERTTSYYYYCFDIGGDANGSPGDDKPGNG